MDWSQLTVATSLVLLIVLLAEAANGWSDAPVGTSAAVASKVLTSKQALIVTALGNFFGLILALYFGAKVAETIGKGIVQAEMITIAAIGVAMFTTILWAFIALWGGFPISKTHSLLAALAGIGWAYGGLAALLPASGNLWDSGWVAVVKGVIIALVLGSALAWFIAGMFIQLRLDQRVSKKWWKKAQFTTVCIVSTGHGFNDGLKYVGIFTLVLLKAGIISTFHVFPLVIFICALVMGGGTLLGGHRIHRRLNGMVNHHREEEEEQKSFKPYMGVSAELVAGLSIWQTGFLGIPMSTNHAVVSAMAGARSAAGKIHTGTIWTILQGWIVTYVFCFGTAYALSKLFLL